MASFLAAFLTIKPGLKLAYSPGPSTPLTSPLNLCIKAYKIPPPALSPSRTLYQTKRPFIHARRSFQKFFRNFFASHPALTPQNSHHFAGIRTATQNGVYVASRRNFSKFFFQNFQSATPALSYIPPKFFQKFFPNF